MSVVDIVEAKATLSKLVRAVESGAESEIVITRDGKPVAKVLPIAAPKKLGHARGEYPPRDHEKFLALDAEVAAMFVGEGK